MKKTASRILALIVALSMLLVPTAFAAERNAGSLTIGNFEITMGEETISIPLYLTLGGGADIENARGYVTLNLSTAEQTAAALLAAVENGEIKAYLNGMNYGLTIPVNQIVEMLEAELGGSIEDLIAGSMGASFSPEMEAAFAALMESAAALEAAPQEEMGYGELLIALGANITKVGETTVTLFDVEANATESTLSLAPITMKGLMDAMGSLSPELDAFYDEYFKLFDQLLAEQGEEITLEQAAEMVTIALEGSIYTAEEGAAGEVVMTLTVEDEAIEIPVYMVTLTDDNGTYTELILDVLIDGEGLYLDMYVDDFADETGAYTNTLYTLSVYDAETNESEVDMTINLYTSDTEDGFGVGADLMVGEGEDVVSMGASHLCYETVLTDEADTYNGVLYLYADVEGELVEIALDTGLTLTSVPAEELLTLSESINPLEADDAALEQLLTDAQTALMQGVGVLMQDPTLAGLLGSMTGLMG